MTTGFFKLFNTGAAARLGCGERRVYAEIGRKHVQVLDWAAGDTAKLSLDEWQGTTPAPIERPKVKYLKQAAQRFGRTAIMKAALDAARYGVTP